MISEALELRMEGGRVSHIWCMCVVRYGYGWLGRAWMACMQDKARRVGRMSGYAMAFPECEVTH